jgi:hypothetical protein
MKTLILLILIFCSFLSYAQQPTLDEVNNIAGTWLLQQNNKNSLKLKGAVDYQMVSVKQVDIKNNLLFHVAELLPKGFIIISNNKSIDPIICYSFISDFLYSTDSTNVLFHLLSTDLSIRERNLIVKSDKWGKELNQLKSKSLNDFQQWPSVGSTTNGGWIETTWTQTEPYNSLCPLDLSQPFTPRSVVGCTATAWAQIINYHKPTKGLELNGTDSYITRTLGINLEADSVINNFPSFARLNQYLKILKQKYLNNQQINSQDIAALDFFVGIQSRMDYTCTGSGASILELPVKAKSGFNSYKFFLGFGQSDWTDFYPVLKSNLMNGLPVMFTINSSSVCKSSHAIICDGYNSDEFYHLNFGWGSISPDKITEAWYKLPLGMPENYNVISEAVVNLTSDRINIYPIEVSKSNIQFGGVKVNTMSKSIIFSFKNPTDRTITITPNIIQGPFELSFNDKDFTKSIGSFSLAPSEQKNIYARGNPDAVKLFSNSWLLEILDSKKYYYTLDFSMTGMNEIGTIVQPGEINGIWTKEKSPYLITGDVYIKHLDSLKINPGVEIKMMRSYKFGIPDDSKIEAVGTSLDSIKFFAEDTLNGWLGIDFMSASSYPNWSGYSSPTRLKSRLEYCIIRDGKSFESYPQWCGGGIFIKVYNNVDITIKNCKITNNQALSGGALIIQDSYNSKIQILNTLITKNRANQGGIIYISATRMNGSDNAVEFTNVTISGNDNNGGTIHMNLKSAAIFNNCIIWGNDSWNKNVFSLGADNHEVLEPDVLEINYCNIDTTNQNWKSFGDVKGIMKWGEGNIVKDPLFDVSKKGGFDFSEKYYLSVNSPCIDAGISNPIYYDKENKDILNHALFPALGTIRNDMGCYGGGIYNFDLPGPVLISPPNNSSFSPGDIDNYMAFIWQYNDLFPKYCMQVSKNREFNNLFFEDTTITTNSQIVNGIISNQITDYYWRVKGKTKINTYSPWSDIRKFNVSTITDIELTKNRRLINVYPNPVLSEFNIEIEGSTDVTKFEIINSTGQTVLQGSFLKKIIVQSRGFSPGLYFLKLENGTKVEFKKILKY